jgi:Ca2+-binding EF-hand superfamily protein
MAQPVDDATLIQQINAAFQLFDKAKNGSCDERDVGTIIHALNLNPSREKAEQLLEDMRGDDPGTFIKRERFEMVMLRVMKFQNGKTAEIPRDSEETILRAFQALDPHKKGYLEMEDLKKAMTIDAAECGLVAFSEDEWESMKNACEDPDSGYVFYEDFAEILAGKQTYSLD